MWFILLIFMQLLVTQAYGMNEKKVQEKYNEDAKEMIEQNLLEPSPPPIKKKIKKFTFDFLDPYGYDQDKMSNQNNNDYLVKNLLRLREKNRQRIISIYNKMLQEHKIWQDRKNIATEALNDRDTHPNNLRYCTINILIDALEHRDHEYLIWLLNKGADPDSCDANGVPALCFAKDVQSVEILLKHGALINGTCQSTGRNALFFLPDSNYDLRDIVECYVKHGININLRDNNNLTALTYLSLQQDDQFSESNKNRIKILLAFKVPYQKCTDKSVRKLVTREWGYSRLEKYIDKKINKNKKAQKQQGNSSLCSIQ